MWCHVRLINRQNRNTERISKQDKKVAANLNYSDIVFPLNIIKYEKFEDIFQIQVNVFVMKIKFILYIFRKSLMIKRLIYYYSLKKTNLTMHLLKTLTD